jgi:type III secretory pathway component EscV
MVELVSDSTAIRYPVAQLERDDQLASHEYRIVINGLPRGGGLCEVDSVAVATAQADEATFVGPFSGSPMKWTLSGHVPPHIDIWRPQELLGAHVAACIQEASWEFTDLDWTKRHLRRLTNPDLEAAARSEFGIECVAAVLGRLTAERFSLRQLPEILERMLWWDEGTALDKPISPSDPVWLAEAVRRRMREYLTFRLLGYSWMGGTVEAVVIDPTVEERFRATGGNGALSAYDLPDPGAFLRVLRTETERVERRDIALLVAADLRPQVHRLIAAQFPRITVMAPEELAENVGVNEIGRISY